MKKNNVDVFIYVQSNNHFDMVSSLATKISRLNGVVKADINPRVKRLLSIKYEPETVSAGAIVSAVKNDGHSASLVGM